MGLLEKWKGSHEMVRFRNEFDDLLERFGFDRDWLVRWPFDRKFFRRRGTLNDTAGDGVLHRGR